MAGDQKMKAFEENMLLSAFLSVYRHLAGALSQSRKNSPNTRDAGNKLGKRQPEQVPQSHDFSTNCSTVLTPL